MVKIEAETVSSTIFTNIQTLGVSGSVVGSAGQPNTSVDVNTVEKGGDSK